MQIIRGSLDLERALASPIDPNLAHVLIRRRDQLADDDYELDELCLFAVADEDDTPTSIEGELGFRPDSNLGSGASLDDPDFTPGWEWREHHEGWTEFAFVLSDDGFGHVLLVPDSVRDPTLQALCRIDA